MNQKTQAAMRDVEQCKGVTRFDSVDDLMTDLNDGNTSRQSIHDAADAMIVALYSPITGDDIVAHFGAFADKIEAELIERIANADTFARVIYANSPSRASSPILAEMFNVPIGTVLGYDQMIEAGGSLPGPVKDGQAIADYLRSVVK